MRIVPKSFFAVSGLCAMALSCASTRSSDAHERSEHPFVVRSCFDETARAHPTVNAKLTASIAQDLSVWRTEVCYTVSREYAYTEHDRAEILARRVTVLVTVTPAFERSSLMAAGLSPGFNADGVISGIIALRDVERLAALPEVISIALVPKMYPL